MHYCADTWFLLQLFSRQSRALDILRAVTNGKDWLTIPLIVYAETTKKLLQQGITEKIIGSFFEIAETQKKVRISYPDKAIATETAKVSLTYSIPLIDSLVAATAKKEQCDALLSGDSDYLPLVKKKYLRVQSW